MTINWTTVNVPTILAVAGAAWGIFSYVGDLDSRIGKMEDYRVTRSASTDREFEAIKTSLRGFQNTLGDLPFRVGALEKGLEEAGRRTDRLSEIVLQNMDGIRKDINALGTKVEVLSSKMDDAFPTRKTQLERTNIPLQN